MEDAQRKVLMKTSRRTYAKYQCVEFHGGKCQKCGLIDVPRCYDVIGLKFNEFENFEKIRGLCEFTQLLCANCHMISTFSEINNNTKMRHLHKWQAMKILGGKCRICGEENYKSIQFHHTGDKDDKLSNMLQNTWYEFRGELSKTVALCTVCHRLVHLFLDVTRRYHELDAMIHEKKEPEEHLIYTHRLWRNIIKRDELKL